MVSPIPTPLSNSADYKTTVIVIPTRNRSGIARAAIDSVLQQPSGAFRVLVSDNSTDEGQRTDLADYCKKLHDSRLAYVRPPSSLSMPLHWDWAIHHALQSYDAGHFLYLTDRMMFKPGTLHEVLDRANAFPDKIISYNHDRIVDDQQPIRIEQHAYTGKLLEVKTLKLSYLYSQSIFHHGFPRMLNCIVPRSVLERIQQRFGSVFSSIAPDFLFCCRALEIEESILYYDRSPIFHYALPQSHGASVTRGEMTAANADFTQNLPIENSNRNYVTPIPQLITAANAIFNEYLAFKEQTNSDRFFDVDLQKYLNVNAEEISQVVDPSLKRQMMSLLDAQGFKPMLNGLPKEIPILRRMGLGLRSALTANWTKGGWVFMSKHFKITPPGNNGFEFENTAEAIEYLVRFPRAKSSAMPWQQQILEAREVEFDS
ncbi:MAG TPA: glycosyltransferase [Pyrinomonadaceae bacterium]|nr:glycosyltransferase [Pyrinomonadaceae bacterium]